MKGPEKYILLIMLLIPVEALPQSSFGVLGGLGTYNMDDLREINKQQANSLPIETVSVDNFNPGFYLGASLNFKLSGQFVIGVIYNYNSTGSRIGQKDYSGYYAYDQIVNGHLIGIRPERIIEKNNSFSVSLSIATGLIFTGMKIRETLSVSHYKEEDSESFTAVSVPFYPEVKISIPVINKLSGTVSLGYLIDSEGKVHLKGNKDAVIGINNAPVKTAWTGLRITGGLIFEFNQSKTKN
jgi:hypothetical protein